MKAMLLPAITDLNQNQQPLTLAELPMPEPKQNELLIQVSTCGVCHTELDEIEGRTPPAYLPITLGHQVIGRVVTAPRGSTHKPDDRVGVAWIFSACGHCHYCQQDQENLCPEFRATGRDAHGGYAEYMTIPDRFAFPIPAIFSDVAAAPLLCAGAIGYRSLRLTGLTNGGTLGLTGFGASAHLVLKMARFRYPDTRIFVFARSETERQFALDLGAVWAGDTDVSAPEQIDAIIDTTPVWKPILSALTNLRPGGRLVINAIRKEAPDQHLLATLDYPSQLWLEKEIKSVANVARRDVSEFLDLAAAIPILPEVQEYPLAAANTALIELKNRQIRGAKVLRIS